MIAYQTYGEFVRFNPHFHALERINQSLADNLLSWKHSGFSIDNSVMIYPHDTKAKESLAKNFIAQVTQHIPLPRVRLVRYYGLYSSRSKEKWAEMDYVAKHGIESLEIEVFRSGYVILFCT